MSLPQFVIVRDPGGERRIGQVDRPHDDGLIPSIDVLPLYDVAVMLTDLTAQRDAYGETLELLRPVFGAAVAEDGEVVLSGGTAQGLIITGRDARLLTRTLGLRNPFHPEPDPTTVNARDIYEPGVTVRDHRFDDDPPAGVGG